MASYGELPERIELSLDALLLRPPGSGSAMLQVLTAASTEARPPAPSGSTT